MVLGSGVILGFGVHCLTGLTEGVVILALEVARGVQYTPRGVVERRGTLVVNNGLIVCDCVVVLKGAVVMEVTTSTTLSFLESESSTM